MPVAQCAVWETPCFLFITRFPALSISLVPHTNNEIDRAGLLVLFTCVVALPWKVASSVCIILS